MNPALVIVLVLLVGVAGAIAGWLLGRQPVGELRARFATRDAEARETDAKFLRAFADLEAARERAGRVDVLSAELADVRAGREVLAGELATLRADAVHHDEQKRLLIGAQDTLRREFEAAGAKVLEGAQEAFLRRAQARFDESEKSSAERLNTLLAPVGERLASYERQVSDLEKQRIDAFGQLGGQIEAIRAGQEQVRAEAARLGNSLRNAPKARGRWGEQQLRNVLEQCGLTEHTDFATEQSIDTDEGRLRPDAIVRIPGNKLLVIDAKVSLNAYQDAFEAEDDTQRRRHLDLHIGSMRNHIQTLGHKSYQSQFAEAPDYVLMFVPGEHFIAAALEHEENVRRSLSDGDLLHHKDLWNYAFDRGVLLASPTNLVAIARTIALVWRQDDLAREAREIGRMGSELHDRLYTAGEHLKRVGAGLEGAVTNYNKFVGSFERNVMTSARRLREKGVETGKGEIGEVPLVESSPRYGAADTPPLKLVEGAEPAAG